MMAALETSLSTVELGSDVQQVAKASCRPCLAGCQIYNQAQINKEQNKVTLSRTDQENLEVP